MEYFTVKNFLWCQGLLALVGVVLILYRGKRVGAKFKWRRSLQAELPAELSRPAQLWGESNERAAPVKPIDKERSLNVFFNFNGHSWDAYETLGVPAGCPIEEAEQAYRSAIEKSASSKDFFAHAIEAIRRNVSGA